MANKQENFVDFDRLNLLGFLEHFGGVVRDFGSE
jgi:hypothetical protein